MRGSILSDPAVVGYLQNYLVVNWEGPDRTEPDDIRAVIQQAYPGPGSNVCAFVLSPDGQVVAGFHPEPWDRGSAATFIARLQQAYPTGEVSQNLRPVTLPGSAIAAGPGGSAGGARLYLTFPREFNAPRPVLEAVSLSDGDRAALHHPGTEAVTVEGHRLGTWLSRAYPPAMMDQDDRVDAIQGNLTLTPKGQGHAELTGQVQMLMRATRAFSGRRIERGRNPQDLTYILEVRVLVNYLPSGDVKDFRGYLTGVYYRPDRRHGAHEPIGINAAVESLPR